MRESFEPVMISKNPGIVQLQDELSKVQNLVSVTITEYQNADELFKPFLLGSPLNAIYQILEHSKMLISSEPLAQVEHFAELLKLHQRMKQYITTSHQQLITKIIDSEVNLFHSLITKILEADLPISWDDYKTLESNFEFLIEQDRLNTQFNIIKPLFVKLHSVLQKRSLQKKIDEEIQKVNDINLNDSLHLMFNISQLKEQLHLLIKKAGVAQLSDSMNHLKKALAQLEKIEVHHIKKQIDDSIVEINKNNWSSITIKKNMYLDLTNAINTFLEKGATEQLTQDEKEIYVDQLRIGFEVCGDERFLELISQCASVFYSQEQLKMQQVIHYVNTAIDSLKKEKLTHKRKRVTFDDRKPQFFEPELKQGSESLQSLVKKRKDLEPVPITVNLEQTEPKNSKIEQLFINILDPILGSERLVSRRFAAAMLKSLASSIRSIEEIRWDARILMVYDLLNKACDICPNDDKFLITQLKESIFRITNDHKRLISDFNKFSEGPKKSLKISTLAHESFKKILTDFIEEMKLQIVPESIDTAVERLLKKWVLTLTEDQFISSELIQKISSVYQVYDQQKNTVIVGNSSTLNINPEPVELPSIEKALSFKNTIEFKDYLHIVKKKFAPNQCLNFLLSKDNNGYTALNRALQMNQFINIELYLQEIKNLMGQQSISFGAFLISQPITGVTALHQIARSGHKGLLIEFTKMLKQELGNEEYARALRVQSTKKEEPFCPKEKVNSDEINRYLNEERKKFPLPSHGSLKKDSFFSLTSTPDLKSIIKLPTSRSNSK